MNRFDICNCEQAKYYKRRLKELSRTIIKDNPLSNAADTAHVLLNQIKSEDKDS